MAVLNWKCIVITYISARMHDSKEFSTAILMFSASGNTGTLMGILSDVWVSLKVNMAAIMRKFIEITFISARIPDSKVISTALITTISVFRVITKLLSIFGHFRLAGISLLEQFLRNLNS